MTQNFMEVTFSPIGFLHKTIDKKAVSVVVAKVNREVQVLNNLGTLDPVLDNAAGETLRKYASFLEIANNFKEEPDKVILAMWPELRDVYEAEVVSIIESIVNGNNNTVAELKKVGKKGGHQTNEDDF